MRLTAPLLLQEWGNPPDNASTDPEVQVTCLVEESSTDQQALLGGAS